MSTNGIVIDGTGSRSVVDRGGRHVIYGGAFIDNAEESLSRAQELLTGIKGGWHKAVGSAIKRAADAGRTASKKAVTSEYAITQSTFLHGTRNVNHTQEDPNGGISVVFGYAGYVLPLLKFDTTVDSGRRVFTRVKRSSTKELLDHAFKAQMGHHIGIYERVGATRLPVRQLFGPAVPQMMYSNEDVMDTIEEKMVETYNVRIEHEITRLLNGWGR